MVTVISVAKPPGVSSNNRAWRRHAALFLSRATSRCRFANNPNTLVWSSPPTITKPGWRNAAIATDRASFGSFFCDLPDPNSRTRAAIIAGTSITRSPAPTSC